MTVYEAAQAIDGTVSAGNSKEACEREIASCYICDLLSYVIGRAEDDCAWVTIMTNVNVLAVASLIGCACVVITEGNEITDEMKAKADELEIPIILTDKTSYGVAKVFAEKV